MKTRWEDWQATFNEVTAKYEAKRNWAEGYLRLRFDLCIRFEARDRFYVMLIDWLNMDVADPKMFVSLEEAIEYISDVDCEKYVDEHREEFQKMI